MISQVFRYTQGGGKNDPSPPKSEMHTPCITSHLIFFIFFIFSDVSNFQTEVGFTQYMEYDILDSLTKSLKVSFILERINPTFSVVIFFSLFLNISP